MKIEYQPETTDLPSLLCRSAEERLQKQFRISTIINSVKEFPAIDRNGREMSWSLQLRAELFE